MARKPMPTYDRIDQVIDCDDLVINVDTAANMLGTSGTSLHHVMENSPDRIPFTYVACGTSTFKIPRRPFLDWLLGPDWDRRACHG